MLKVVLCCGSGASSGFMAQNIKKAAKKRGLEMEVTARSESLIESFLDQTDIVLIAPHLKAESELIAKRCGAVPTMVIDRQSYGMLDGEKVLNQVLKVLDKKGEA